jgi:integrase/recombinase XerD
VYRFIGETSHVPEVDKVKLGLSRFAGMRAREIALLEVRDVLDADGRVSLSISIRPEISKNRKGRTIPMHPRLAQDIKAFRNRYPLAERFALSMRGKALYQSPHTVVQWFWKTYRALGLTASSHSGRRYFITTLSRVIHKHGGSLRDVQLYAGHARLDTTQTYIEPSENLGRAIASIGAPETLSPSIPWGRA